MSEKDLMIRDVDSLYKAAKKNNPGEVLVYYSDGVASVSGLVIWKLNESIEGIAYLKLDGKSIQTRKIKKRYFSEFNPLGNCLSNISYAKSDTIKKHLVSHDYNVVWVYDGFNNIDTTSISASKLLTNGDTPYSRLYFTFLNMYTKVIR